MKGLKAPAIWLPHGIFGISTSGFVYDSTKGKFGPFENQLLVGDQGQSKIMRVALEKVKGQYQGRCLWIPGRIFIGNIKTIVGYMMARYSQG